MNRKELISGTIITFIFLVLFIFGSVDSIELVSRGSPLSDTPASSLQPIIAWLIAGYTFILVFLAVWFVGRSNKLFQKFVDRFTIRAVIPGFYVVTLLPVILGLSLAVVTGLGNWGIGLMCMSIPVLAIFFFLALKTRPE